MPAPKEGKAEHMVWQVSTGDVSPKGTERIPPKTKGKGQKSGHYPDNF